MQTGKMSRRITIEQNLSTGKDEYGANVDNWVEVRTCWASMEPLSGREYFSAAQVQAEQMTRFRIRYLGIQVFPGMRVKYHDGRLDTDRYFDIQAVIDQNEMHVEVWLMTVEHVKIPA